MQGLFVAVRCIRGRIWPSRTSLDGQNTEQRASANDGRILDAREDVLACYAELCLQDRDHCTKAIARSEKTQRRAGRSMKLDHTLGASL